MKATPTQHSPTAGAPDKAHSLKLAVAFACVYFIWGSTFLGIRFAIETLPPLWMAGVRFVLAGSILYGWVAIRGAAERPTSRQWAVATLQGGLFFLGGNGAVTWAEKRVPSGIAALVVAMIPLWMVLLEWARKGGTRPTRGVWVGLVLGFLGIALLVSGGRAGGPGGIDVLGGIALLISGLSWSVGSIYTRNAERPSNPLQSNAMQMLAGGILLLLAAWVSGEWARLDLDLVSVRSVLSLLYLSVFGSVIAFSAYSWLLHATTPAQVSTYAFVNPMVAVFLGWALAGEVVTSRTLVAAAVIVAAVAIIVLQRARSPRASVTSR